MNKLVPLGLHGDGTPAMGSGKSWSQNVDIWSWTSLLINAPSQISIYFIWLVHATLRTGETLDLAFKKMAWSFNALWACRWPSHDWNDVPMSYPMVLYLS